MSLLFVTVVFTIVKRPLPGTESKLEIKTYNSTTVGELKERLYQENKDMPPPPDITIRFNQTPLEQNERLGAVDREHAIAGVDRLARRRIAVAHLAHHERAAAAHA